MNQVAVVIPALNEAGNIGDLVPETAAQPHVSWVVVVDNGSTDNTGEVAREAGAVVVTEPRRGYGQACAAGTLKGIELGAEIIVYMDGDYSSLPAEMHRLINPILADQADLVLGSRVLGDIAANAMPVHQQFGNWLSAKVINVLYGTNITDLGPYRAISARLVQSLNMREMTFGWPTEMKVKVANRNGRMIEVPVSWHNRRTGKSKVGGTIRGSILAAWYILGVAFRYAIFRR